MRYLGEHIIIDHYNRNRSDPELQDDRNEMSEKQHIAKDDLALIFSLNNLFGLHRKINYYRTSPYIPSLKAKQPKPGAVIILFLTFH
jgi:hypothetical protein